MKKTIGKIGKTGGKVVKHALLIQPIRILIIINSIFLPLLLGILVFIILKYAQNIEGIINKAKKIEQMVEDNIKEGILMIKEGYAKAQGLAADASLFIKTHISTKNTKIFIKETLLQPLVSYINPTVTDITLTIKDKIDNLDLKQIQLDVLTSLLDVSGHSVNDIIKHLEPVLLSENLCTQEEINKVLKENRSIAYILSHHKLIN